MPARKRSVSAGNSEKPPSLMPSSHPRKMGNPISFARHRARAALRVVVIDLAVGLPDSRPGGIMPFDIQTSCASPTGAVLNLHVSKAKGTPRAVIQVNHGLA